MKRQEMMEKTRHILPLALLAVAMTAHAQLDNTVEVTNEVQPVVNDADKINAFPDPLDTPAKRTKVEYQMTAQPLAKITPDPLAKYNSDAADKGNRRGYAHAAGGSHGQVDAEATYQFDITRDDLLSIDLSLAGFNTKQTKTENAHRMYKNHVGGRYDHVFSSGLNLYVKGGFDNHVFNYEHESNALSMTDKQHCMLGGFTGGIMPWEIGDLTLTADFGYSYFRQERATNLNSGLKERLLQGNVNGCYEFSGEHYAEVGAEFFQSGYSNAGIEGITHLHFTPHYIYKGDDMRIQLGVVAGSDGDIAPDVRLAYHLTPSSDLYANVIGYDRDNNLRRFSDIHPYFALGNIGHDANGAKAMKLDAEFHKIDASVGYRFGDMSVSTGGKLSGNVNVGFDMAENSPLLSGVMLTSSMRYPIMMFGEAKRMYANIDLTYAHADILKLDVKTQLNKWKCRADGASDWASGNYTAPALSMAWTADVKILDGLHAGATWELGSYDNPDIQPEMGGTVYKRPTLSNLGVSAHYTLPASVPISVFVKGDNLLNQKDTRYFNYHNIGANVLAGVAVSF